MPTKVINIKDAPTDWLDRANEFVYLGRKGKGHKGPFGNPYRLTSENDRALVLKAYRSYFKLKLEYDADFSAAIDSLAGKTLVCFCKPLACHGDVIMEYLNERT